MRIPLRFRHPIRWRWCVREAKAWSDIPGIQLTPGQAYTLRYGPSKRWKRSGKG